MEKERVILGIDPGTNVLGYSIIEQRGKQSQLLKMDVLVLGTKDDLSTKMKKLFDQITEIIDIFKPDILAIEAPFFGKNVQSMLKLGRAQGICIAAAFSRSIPFVEYSPRKVKQSITGNGAASKEQVANMLQRMFNFESIPSHLDATDALAVAVCHSYQKEDLLVSNSSVKKTSSKKSSWASFVSQNPDRIK
ncbi:MAG: crossover junction endodeoxyribonuclease RuvC [Bacteroidales bacterium]|nr:crossover junction endodeoxyribonuclease RuvC [Bacteroidales bacterium]